MQLKYFFAFYLLILLLINTYEQGRILALIVKNLSLFDATRVPEKLKADFD